MFSRQHTVCAVVKFSVSARIYIIHQKTARRNLSIKGDEACVTNDIYMWEWPPWNLLLQQQLARSTTNIIHHCQTKPLHHLSSIPHVLVHTNERFTSFKLWWWCGECKYTDYLYTEKRIYMRVFSLIYKLVLLNILECRKYRLFSSFFLIQYIYLY